MKILYGIQGTGNGHTTRARHMAKALDKHPDIQVDYLFSGRSANTYFDMHDFTPYKTRQGFTFVSNGGQIRHIKTLLNNNMFRFFKDVSNLQVSDYDLLVNDFEPVTAWTAKKEGIPSLSISHQAAFLHGVPIRKQYEQISNAYTMEKLGLCQVLNSINAEDIDEWLNTRQGVQVDFPTNCDEPVKWIKQGQWHATEKLRQHLWQQVRFPIQVQERLSTLSRAM